MRTTRKGATSRRYGEAFKRAMVIELESGRKTEGEIRRQYGIKGAVTIAGWLRRYGKRPMRTPLKVASSKKKAPESQERLSQENRELKTALA